MPLAVAKEKKSEKKHTSLGVIGESVTWQDCEGAVRVLVAVSLIGGGGLCGLELCQSSEFCKSYSHIGGRCGGRSLVVLVGAFIVAVCVIREVSEGLVEGL